MFNKKLVNNLYDTLLLGIPILLFSWVGLLGFYFFEKGENIDVGKFGDAFWWWIVTISSVGYGDITPVTIAGRLFGGVVIISSFLILGLVVAEFSAIIKLLTHKKKYGLDTYKGKDHFVILGENSLLAGLIEHFKDEYPDEQLVIVTDKFSENHYKGVSFIKGDPKDPYVLDQANISNASLVIVLADDQVNNPDAYTLVISDMVEKVNRNVTTISELTDESYKKLFEKSQLDFFVSEKSLLSDLDNYDDIFEIIRGKLG